MGQCSIVADHKASFDDVRLTPAVSLDASSQTLSLVAFKREGGCLYAPGWSKLESDKTRLSLPVVEPGTPLGRLIIWRFLNQFHGS
ncbi:hypothetical protein BS17DRAFT_112902 [Gyrodon lividus]|nr:hypothetical protein BS17DRAFT_112902 [Gyrodon lividus]